MDKRPIADNVFWMGALDWDRRIFDSLIPLPDGTTYNAYLVRGREKTALMDAVDPLMSHVLMGQLEDVPTLDYLVCHHAEQDHSGAIPDVLAKYPAAKVVCTEKCAGMIQDHLRVKPERIVTVKDGETLSLGGKTLRFVHTPWVHWPETMCTCLQEDRILFSCDFFGSHLAGSALYSDDDARVYEAAKRYYAEIMMPFRQMIKNNLEKLKGLKLSVIAPSHGPVHRRPEFILEAYRDWALAEPKNLAVVARVSMHGSTALMAERLVAALVRRGVEVQQHDLAGADIGKLAMSLVDASTLVVATPAVLVGPHPAAAYAAFLANALRPKLKHVGILCSYGWGSKVVEQLAGMLGNLRVDVLPPVLCKGLPGEKTLEEVEKLAETIAEKHGQGVRT